MSSPLTSFNPHMDLRDDAFEIRRLIVEMTSQREGAHVGGSLSIADVMCVLFHRFLRVNPLDPSDPARDYFILSKGHCAAVLYAILARRGFFPLTELKTYAANGSRLAGHPSGHLPGVEFPTGSLGHGLPLGVGTALGLQRLGKSNRTFVVMGDGELQEGSVWEAAASAARFRLSNLTAIIDSNSLQINGQPDAWLPPEAPIERWKSFGWECIACDGHDLNDIERALQRTVAESSKPKVLFAKTTKSKGLPSLENDRTSHYAAFMPETRKKMLAELERGRT